MRLTLRVLLIVAGCVALLLAIAFLANVQPVVRLWPFSGYGLSKVFVASILAAIGAPVLWIGISGEFASLAGGGANLLVSGGGVGVYGLIQAMGGAGRVLPLALTSLAVAALSAALIWYGLTQRFRDSRPTPRLVRASFILFVIALVIAGGSLVARVPNVFPWTLDGDSSVVYGFAFLGAAAYFGYGVVRPVWGNAKGQLLAFLAYDLVLIGPYLAHWTQVAESQRLSLILYVAVLLLSGAIATYYLLMARESRLWAAPAGGAPASAVP